MTVQQNPLEWLEQFFQSNCDGDWEHEYGFSIESTSDPGWKFVFDLSGTAHENLTLKYIEDNSAPISWLRCEIKESTFIGFSSPRRLGECIAILRDVVEGRRR